MNSNIKGVERINARIIAEAEEFAADQKARAEAEAEKILSAATKSSGEKVNAILDRANEKAAALIESAKSSAGMRERNSMLALKVEMMEKAFEKALEKIIGLPDDKYVTAIAALLAETANSFLFDGAKAEIYFGEKDTPLAEKILAAAKNAITVNADIAVGNKNIGAKAGFVLACGDTEVNCSAETIIASAKNSLEKQVLGILFGEA